MEHGLGAGATSRRRLLLQNRGHAVEEEEEQQQLEAEGAESEAGHEPSRVAASPQQHGEAARALAWASEEMTPADAAAVATMERRRSATLREFQHRVATVKEELATGRTGRESGEEEAEEEEEAASFSIESEAASSAPFADADVAHPAGGETAVEIGTVTAHVSSRPRARTSRAARPTARRPRAREAAASPAT